MLEGAVANTTTMPTQDRLGLRWRVLGLLCLGIVFAMTPWFSATAILPELKVAWSVGEIGAAWLTNAVQIGFVVGALGSSILNIPDIVSPRRLMTWGALLAAVLNLGLLLVDTAAMGIALRFLTGVVLAAVYPPAMKLATTWFVKGRGLALGLVIGALTIGSGFPHLLRSAAGSVDWAAVVIATSALTLVAVSIFHFLISEGPHAYSKAKFDPSQIGAVLRDRGVALANLGYFGHMWELYAMWGWFLAFSAEVLRLNTAIEFSSASLLTFVVIGVGAVGCVLGGYLADRIGRTTTTALMMIVSGACALLIGLTYNGPLWLFLTIAIIWGVTVIGDSAQFSAMVTEIADRSLVGTALTLQMGIGFAITVLSIQLVPAVAEWFGSWQWAFIILAPGPLIGTVAILILRRLPEATKIAQGLR